MHVATNQAVLERLKIVTGKTDITLEHRLVEDLLIDSFSFIRIIVDLENHLDILFDDDDLVIESFPSIQDLSNYISKMVV